MHRMPEVSAYMPQGQDDATLQSVCYKPFGEECATQSLLQYWQMNETLYEFGYPPKHTKQTPEFCFDHWSTQARTPSANPQKWLAPIIVATVLGSLPYGSIRSALQHFDSP